jgi:triosephosphate isomerase (TIM)
MTNKYMYFVANWKMYGDLKTLKSLNKVMKFSKSNKNYKFKMIYCPPNTLLYPFIKKLKNSSISTGAQNCHSHETYGPFTGSVSSKMIKTIGAEFVIIGHSENRSSGDTDHLINKKIKSAINNGLKVIFCFGESLNQRKKKLTNKVLFNQIKKGISSIKKTQNIIFAYEPIWSIGTGAILKKSDLEDNIEFIKNKLKINLKIKKPKVIYGGSVNPKNINNLKEINNIDGFLIGGASLDSKKFIDIVKKTFI